MRRYALRCSVVVILILKYLIYGTMKSRFKQVTLNVDEVKPNPKNPRIDLKPGMPLYEKLKHSIEHFDYVDPIIWNKTTGMIVSGHQRFQVMKDIAEAKCEKFDKVDVMQVEMTEAEQDSFMVAVNKITGLWDTEKLSALFQELNDEDLSYTGYDEFEIQALIGQSEPETYSEEGFEEYIDNAEGQLKTYNVIISCATDDEQEWVKKLIKEEDRLKRGYRCAELMERFSDD